MRYIGFFLVLCFVAVSLFMDSARMMTINSTGDDVNKIVCVPVDVSKCLCCFH